MFLHNDIQEILYTEEQIQDKIRELGEILSKEYENRNPLVICLHVYGRFDEKNDGAFGD